MRNANGRVAKLESGEKRRQRRFEAFRVGPKFEKVDVLIENRRKSPGQRRVQTRQGRGQNGTKVGFFDAFGDFFAPLRQTQQMDDSVSGEMRDFDLLAMNEARQGGKDAEVVVFETRVQSAFLVVLGQVFGQSIEEEDQMNLIVAVEVIDAILGQVEQRHQKVPFAGFEEDASDVPGGGRQQGRVELKLPGAESPRVGGFGYGHAARGEGVRQHVLRHEEGEAGQVARGGAQRRHRVQIQGSALALGVLRERGKHQNNLKTGFYQNEIVNKTF